MDWLMNESGVGSDASSSKLLGQYLLLTLRANRDSRLRRFQQRLLLSRFLHDQLLPIPGGGSIKLLVDVTLMHRWPERNFSGPAGAIARLASGSSIRYNLG